MLKVRSLVGVAAVLIVTPLMGLPAWADTCANTNLSLVSGANSPVLFNTASSGLQGFCNFDGLTFSNMSFQINLGSLGTSPSIIFETQGNEIGMNLGYTPSGATADFVWKFTVTADPGLIITDAFAQLTGHAPATLDETLSSTGNPTPPTTVGQIHLDLSLPNGSSGFTNITPPQFQLIATKNQFTGVGGDASSLFNGFSLVPGPVAGAGLPGLVAACGGLIGLARRRRRQIA
jgi:hypothetical protein